MPACAAKRDQHLHGGRGQRHRPRVGGRGQHAADVARARRAGPAPPGPSGRCSRAGLRHPLVVAEVVQRERLAAGQHHARQPSRPPAAPGRAPPRRRPRGMLDDQLRAVRASGRASTTRSAPDISSACWVTRASTSSGSVPGQQPLGDLGAGPQPALLAARLLVQPGVVDRHAGRGGERDQQRLVLLVELGAVFLLGQVEVAVHLVADPDRHAQEGPHRRVPVREAGRLAGWPRYVGQAQRARVGDQLAEQAAALRPVVDPGDLRPRPGRPGRTRPAGRPRR